MKKFFLLVCIACLLAAPLKVFAATDMEIGVALYNKGNYKDALDHFNLTLRKNPNDYNAMYYEASTFYHLKQADTAAHYFRLIVDRFPTTVAGQNSLAALSKLDPAYYQKVLLKARKASRQPNRANAIPTGTQAATGSDASADWASLPAQARIPYHREGQNLVVTAYVNGRPIDMFFDSGAEGVVMRKSELEALGIKPPQGKSIGVSYGVGDGGGQQTWVASVTLKVGQIERRNFTVHVQDDPPGGNVSHPLLGQTFFRDFSYTLDPSPDQTSGTILFQKKGVASNFAANDSSLIPFRNMGKDILVSVEVNSRPIIMIFDTGAENCCFTIGQLQAVGLSIPEGTPAGLDAGIAGTTRSWKFNCPRMQLGPIIKTDVPISVIESSGIPYPLLGNSFLHDLRMDIDNSAHMMRVRR